MKTRKELAAETLQSAICDAICSPFPDIMAIAQDWLMVNERPTIEEIISPDPTSFIGTCRTLGINWSELQRTVASAVDLPENGPHLRLVQSSELAYNGSYAAQHETTVNCHRTSATPKGERQLHCAPLSLAAKRSETHQE